MTFLYIVFYLIIIGILGFNFMGSLEKIDVQDEHEDGSTSNREVDALTNRSWMMIGIALVWTGFAFWYMGQQSLYALFYY